MLAVPFMLWITGLLMIGIQFGLAVYLDNVVEKTARDMSFTPGDRTAAYVTTQVCKQMNTFAYSSACGSGGLQVYAVSGSAFGALTPATLSGTILSPSGFSAGPTAGGGQPLYVLLQVAWTSPFTLPGGFLPNLTMVASAPYQNSK